MKHDLSFLNWVTVPGIEKLPDLSLIKTWRPTFKVRGEGMNLLTLAFLLDFCSDLESRMPVAAVCTSTGLRKAGKPGCFTSRPKCRAEGDSFLPFRGVSFSNATACLRSPLVKEVMLECSILYHMDFSSAKFRSAAPLLAA